MKNSRNCSTTLEEWLEIVSKETSKKIVGLTLCYWVTFVIILCFERKEFVFLMKIVLHVKKEIRGSGKDHLHPRHKKQV